MRSTMAMDFSKERAVRQIVLKEEGEDIEIVEVNVGELPNVNDFCRFCSKQLRINGIIGHSSLIFAPGKSQPHQRPVADRLAQLGLVLKPSKSKSTRMCKSCVTLADRLAKDLAVFNKWKEEEEKAEETASSPDSSEAGGRRARSPSPASAPSLPRPLPKKPRAHPPPHHERRSVTKVITTFPSKTIVKVVADSEAGIIQHIAGQNWTTAANLLSTHKDLFDEIKSKVLIAIHEECLGFLNPNNKCMLWKNTPDDVKTFSFDNLMSELEQRSPFLLALFQTLTNNNNEDAACTALCIALRGREPRLSAFSYYVNNIIARGGGISKVVFTRLCKMGITTSYANAKSKQKEMKGTAAGETTQSYDELTEPFRNPDEDMDNYSEELWSYHAGWGGLEDPPLPNEQSGSSPENLT